MKKILLLLCFQSLLVGCTSQIEYTFFVDFHNVCNTPVHVVAHHYTNFDEVSEATVLTQQLDVNKTLTVLKTWGFSNSGYAVSPLYELVIYAGDRKRDFDKNTFIEILKESKLESNSGVYIYTWTISDSSLCPK
jgi:hypothetical protein